jgi:hypothetical protein
VQAVSRVLEMKTILPLESTNNEGFMRRVWRSVWPSRAGKLANQTGAGGYRMQPSPVLELGRVNGKLVLMGRNQAMKMLIQATQGAPEDSRASVSSNTGLQ